MNLPFLLCFTLKGRFNGGFFALPVLGAHTWRDLFLEFSGTLNGSVDFKKSALITSKIERPY